VGPDGEYARFLAAAVELADASGELSRRGRRLIALALVQACESDSRARAALVAGGTDRLEQAAAGLGSARTALVEAVSAVNEDAARRRLLVLL
jgi:hypothetical protein